MATTGLTRYHLDDNGSRYEVHTRSAGLHTTGRLYVDGVLVDEQESEGQKIRLEGGGLVAVVKLNWLDRITEVLAVPSGTDPKRADAEGVAFAPAPGSRAARLEKLKREHPNLYAARHVAIAVAQVLVGVLGIGALLSGLLPRIDLPAVPIPDLPAIPWPDIPWPNIPLPAIDVPDLPFLDQIQALWSAVNWLVPIVIAVLIAINEVHKRRKREQAASARRQSRA